MADRSLGRSLDRKAGTIRVEPPPRPRDNPKAPVINSALARGLEVLRAFSIEDPYLGNKELFERTSISKPTLSRLTATLCDLGYLNFSESRQKYEISPGILTLARTVLFRARIRSEALCAMGRLSSQANAVVTLVTLERDHAITLEVVQSNKAISKDLSVGFRTSLAGSASGLACLSALGPEKRRTVLDALKKDDGDAWGARKARIDEAMDKFARNGFYGSEEEFDSLLNAVAVPFADNTDDHIYAFSMFVPAYRIDKEELESIWGPRLLDMLREIGPVRPC